ncbi:hypothetical protein C8Q76DRAFT_801940 [Earliella scabrosa]|nr:hypothetical protein C8Q76DRAFT_801940 [Earliella scabrosa]
MDARLDSSTPRHFTWVPEALYDAPPPSGTARPWPKTEIWLAAGCESLQNGREWPVYEIRVLGPRPGHGELILAKLPLPTSVLFVEGNVLQYRRWTRAIQGRDYEFPELQSAQAHALRDITRYLRVLSLQDRVDVTATRWEEFRSRMLHGFIMGRCVRGEEHLKDVASWLRVTVPDRAARAARRQQRFDEPGEPGQGPPHIERAHDATNLPSTDDPARTTRVETMEMWHAVEERRTVEHFADEAGPLAPAGYHAERERDEMPASVHAINSSVPMTDVEIRRAPLIELVNAHGVETRMNAGQQPEPGYPARQDSGRFIRPTQNLTAGHWHAVAEQRAEVIRTQEGINIHAAGPQDRQARERDFNRANGLSGTRGHAPAAPVPIPEEEERPVTPEGTLSSPNAHTHTAPTEPRPLATAPRRAQPLPIDQRVVNYLARQWPARMEEARIVANLPAPFGPGYRDIRRVRIIGGVFRDLGIGTRKQDPKECDVNDEGRYLTVTTQDVMITFGILPVTYGSLRSRLDLMNAMYLWLDENRGAWDAAGPSSEAHMFWSAMRVFFAPERLPSTLTGDIPAAVRDAIQKGTWHWYKVAKRIHTSLGMLRDTVPAPHVLVDN